MYVKILKTQTPVDPLLRYLFTFSPYQGNYYTNELVTTTGLKHYKYDGNLLNSQYCIENEVFKVVDKKTFILTVIKYGIVYEVCKQPSLWDRFIRFLSFTY